MVFYAGVGAARLLRTVAVLTATVLSAVLFLPRWFWSSWPIGVAVIPFVGLPPIWYYIGRLTASLQGVLTSRAVSLRYGVFWQREWFVPVTALRTFEVWTPPLHRLFRCRTVVLRFAGGAAYVPLLSREAAADLIVRLEQLEVL